MLDGYMMWSMESACFCAGGCIDEPDLSSQENTSPQDVATQWIQFMQSPAITNGPPPVRSASFFEWSAASTLIAGSVRSEAERSRRMSVCSRSFVLINVFAGLESEECSDLGGAALRAGVMSFQFRVGKKSLKWTDKLAKIILEVLGAMRVVKYFCYEQLYLQASEVRHEELKGIKKIQVARSQSKPKPPLFLLTRLPDPHSSVAAVYSVPVLAATIAFVTYTSTSHSFGVAIIFSSLSLFQLLRQRLMFLPRALSATTDAQNALARLRKVFDAETADPADAIAVDREQEHKEEEDDAEAAAEEDVTEAAAKRTAPGAVDDAKTKAVAVQQKGAGTGKLEGRLIVREKRTTGSVSWRACMFAMQGTTGWMYDFSAACDKLGCQYQSYIIDLSPRHEHPVLITEFGTTGSVEKQQVVLADDGAVSVSHTEVLVEDEQVPGFA
ncbi:hypothetical protein VTO73DRAFT_14531 [Trametes versicolor]